MSKTPIKNMMNAAQIATGITGSSNITGALGGVAGMGSAAMSGSVGQALGGQQSSDFQNQVTESLSNITQKLENSNPGNASMNTMPSAQTRPLDNTINTFSSAASEKGASIYGSQEQRQSSVGYPSDPTLT